MSTSLRVLIVEDSEDDMALVVRELRRGGYEPTFERVDTPAGMTAALGKNQWDVVICDYSMPHFSGTDALRLLRTKGSEAPCIVLSGTIGEETAIAVLKQGAQDYVMKDNLKRLLPAIQRELGEAEQRRERKRLEHQVQELQKFEAIGRLAGGIAHDFNNALGVILGWAQLGYDNVPDDSPVRENFRMIRDQAQRSAGLILTGTPADTSCSPFPIQAREWMQQRWTASSSLFSPRKRWAKGPGWDWRRCT